MRILFRFRNSLIVLSVLVLLYALLGFFILPYIVKSQVFPAVSEQLKRPVLVKEVAINPFALTVKITGFEIQEVDQTPLLGFDELFVNFEFSSLMHRAYRFDEIRLVMPFVSVRIMPSGTLNLLELAKVSGGPNVPDQETPSAKDGAEKKLFPPIEIALLQISRGIVEFRDDSKPKPFEVSIVPIEIMLRNFSTRRGGENVYAFTAEVRKEESLNWEGTISLDPIQSEGKFSLTGVRGPVLWLYVKDRFRFDIPDGVLNISARYRFDAAVEPFNLILADGELSLTNLKLAESGQDDVLIAVPSFLVHGMNVDVAKQTVEIASVESKDATFKGWLNQDGTVNYQALIAPQPSDSEKEIRKEAASASASVPSKEQRPWSVDVKEIGMKNYAVDFEDRTTPTPARHRIDALDFTVKDVRVPFKEPVSFGLGLNLNESGRVEAKGTVGVDPVMADIALNLSEIPIAPFQPYFDNYVRVDVVNGGLNVNGTVQFQGVHPKGPLLRYTGDIAVRNLSLADRSSSNELFSLKALTLTQLAVDVEPTSLKLGEVVLQEPSVYAIIDSDGTLNFSQLAEPQVEKAPIPAAQPAESRTPDKKQSADPVPIAIDVVKLVKAKATFTDRSINPSVVTGISELTGTIKGLSSKQIAKANVSLAGRIDNVAPFKINGQINPLSEDAYTDLTFDFANMDLTTAAPYAGKYIGYPITKGKLSLDLKYKVSQKHLDAENKMLVDQLTLGESTNSPDATSLPVRLALALLKDRKGQIDIDLPVKGDLNDPDFKYGRALLKVLGNLITKIATSPFTLMGNLIPGGGDAEELQYLEFDPGAVAFVATELKKVEALTKGLEERPGLRLEITGTADPIRDRKVLGLQKLKAQLLARWQQGKGLSKKEGDLPIVEEERIIKELFDQQRTQQPVATPAQGAQVAQVASKPPTVEEMRQQLVAAMPVPDSDLHLLAQQRAEQMRGQFAGDGKLGDERLFLTEVDLTASDHEKVRSRLNITAGQ